VATRIDEFEEAGVDLLLLQCSPQLEEMERFAVKVIRKVPLVQSELASGTAETPLDETGVEFDEDKID
jgi:FMNH2-dependent dimethyl sulfone monooxygenase